MKKFFDSRREQGGSGAGSGTLGGIGTSSGLGSGYIGRVFNIGRHQVTVDEVLAEESKTFLSVMEYAAGNRGTIRAASNFSAEEDAQKLRKAMKGLGESFSFPLGMLILFPSVSSMLLVTV
ncbi:hypothetical protein JD844_030939 [Phrynosoma platyrhinos]|uniref:Uncharacterized protein n=1 Tax=Phrynosoma platyrhinos TaxID=52577 RepID=A0ABQ7T0U2_PHRPL|nr:hypothetical protein JD844_030939 [Phrynosoma platyrhinos]